MTTREKIEAMAADGTLVEAVLPLVEAAKSVRSHEVYHPLVREALKAFEPSLIDAARDALRRAGFVNVPANDLTKGDTIQIASKWGFTEYWRLEGGKS